MRERLRAAFAVLLLLTGVWVMLAPLDVVATAVGEIIPASRVKAIQHLEGGIVSEILVEEGTRVEKGQPLIRLDPVRAAAELDELTRRLTALSVEIHRLTAEATAAAAPDIPEALAQAAPDLVAAARDLFANRRRRLEHDVKGQENLIEQRRNEISEISVRLGNSRRLQEIIGNQVHISETLLGRDLTSRMVHLDMLRQQQTLRTQIESDQAALPRAQAALREAQERLGAMREANTEQARRDLAQAQQARDELSERVRKFQNIQERTVLRAPVAGIIKTLAVATEGGVINPGQVLAEIVPLGDRLIIEARLPIQDIGHVHAGQEVRVMLNTPEATLYGHLDGVVRRVSPDAIATANNQTFYKIRIETLGDHFEGDGRHYQLYPGMQVLCTILLGQRTVFAYLISPWFRSLRFAFQER